MIVGITGCPGSGKTILAREFSRNGWILLNADDIGREVVEQNKAILDELAEAFGDDILDAEGKLRRRDLRRLAFSDQEKTLKLNSIVHPPLIRLLKQRVDALRISGGNVVVDCALIFEWGIEGIFNEVICVAADIQLRKERIMLRDGSSAREIDDLCAAQFAEIEKIRRAGIIIKNNGSVESLKVYGRLFAHLPEYSEEVISD
jgi:dephospho-CoA kinase